MSAPNANPLQQAALLSSLQPKLLEQLNQLLANGKLTHEQLAHVRALPTRAARR
jgi:hypothetical protein